ncbi:MAG: hypothetical protein K0V04_12895 [Deltaproteobacteria bacterium]|nr:hypothetical protein [Deltaproteobacteria bacterium]
MTLRIQDESTIVLEGHLDSTGDLQFRYGTTELSAHGDSIEAVNNDAVRFVLRVPPGATGRVEHEGSDGVVTWASSDNERTNSLPPAMTDPASVKVYDAANSTPKKVIHLQVNPQGGLPDT